jgi:hypothetical protein
MSAFALGCGDVERNQDVRDGEETSTNLNEYEEMRARNIRRNNKVLESLGLGIHQPLGGRPGKPAARGKRDRSATRSAPEPGVDLGVVSNRRNPDRGQSRPVYKDVHPSMCTTGPASRSRLSTSAVSDESDTSATQSLVSDDSHSHDYDSVAAVSEEHGGADSDEDESAGGVVVDRPKTKVKRRRSQTAVAGDKTQRLGRRSKTGADEDESAGGVGVHRATGTRKRHGSTAVAGNNLFKHRPLPKTAEHTKLVWLAHYPLDRAGQLLISSKKSRPFHFSWALLINVLLGNQGEDYTGLRCNLLRCPLLPNLPALTMDYLHREYWGGSSGGLAVLQGGQPLPDAYTNPAGMEHWLGRFTDGSKHGLANNQQGGIAIFSGLQLAGSSVSLRASSPHADHTYHGHQIIGCDVVWVSCSESEVLQESEIDQLPDEEYIKRLQYGHVECFFSFVSRDDWGKYFTHDMALVRKMHRLEYEGCGSLLATCAGMESNPKCTKMLQVINVQRILSDAVLVRHEQPATIPCSWAEKVSSMPDGITTDSSDGRGDGSSLWHLPVHVRRRKG